MIVRTVLLVLAVALASPAAAAGKTVPEKTGGTKAARVQKGTPAKPGAKSPSTAAANTDEKKAAAAPTATPAQLAAAMRTKRNFRYAADACSRPSKCDETLRDEAKGAFMDACMACTTEERCEQERDAILDGSAKGSTNPCAQ